MSNSAELPDFPELFERQLSSEVNRLRLEGRLSDPLADALRDVLSCVRLARMKVVPSADSVGPAPSNEGAVSAGGAAHEAAQIARLMRFYNVETVEQLIAIQSHHIERLQARLPPMTDERPRRVREG